MANDLLSDFLQSADTPILDVREGYFDPNQKLAGPTSLVGQLKAGTAAGAQGMAADLEYFSALGDTLMGDEKAAEAAVRRATIKEDLGHAPKAGLESFEQFLESPTLEGFLGQSAQAVGEVFPSLISSIAGGGIGGILGKAGVSVAGKKVAERIAADAIKRVARNNATDKERLLANIIYKNARSSIPKYGALAGAAASEYAPLAGGNLSEALQSDQELNADTALRAGLVAAPQAALGVGGEYLIARRLFKDIAKDRAVREGSLFSEFAKNIAVRGAQGGFTEAATEVGQEGIGVINRMDMDSSYTAQDAQLRLAQAAFMGFMGGAAAGGAGGVASTTVQNASELSAKAGRIYDKATDMVDQIRTRQMNDQIDGEQYGDILSGYTTPESEADIAAQVDAMHDPSSTKQSVWIAGDAPVRGARYNTVATVTDERGRKTYAAFIPGRGTIVSTSEQIVTDVITSRASDRVLAAALGYSSAKSDVIGGDIVVQALDADGNVVSEEVTNEDNKQAAMNAAEGLKPEGGSVRLTTADVALEERRKRAEGKPADLTRQNMQFDDATLSGLGYGTIVDENGDVQLVDAATPDVSKPYAPKRDKGEFFDNTSRLRASFAETFADVFGEINWTDDFFGGMSESFMNAAINTATLNPTSDVQVRVNQDGQYEIAVEQSAQDAENAQANQLIAKTVNISRNTKSARNSAFKIVTPKGASVGVNFNSLVILGKQLLNAQGVQNPSTREAVSTAIAELQLGGYDVTSNGQSILQIGNGPIPAAMDAQVGTFDGRSVVLSDILGNKQKTAAPKKNLTYISETDAFFQFPQLFEGQLDPAAYEQGLNAEGYTSDKDKAGAKKGYDYFDPNNVEDVIFDGGEIGQMQEQLGPNEQQAKDAPKTRMNVEEGDPYTDKRGDARTTPSTGPKEGSAAADPVTRWKQEEEVISETEVLERVEELSEDDVKALNEKALGQVASEIVNKLLDGLGLKRTPRILTLSQIKALSFEELVQLTGSVSNANQMATWLDEMTQDDQTYGMHVAPPVFAKEDTRAPVIVVQDNMPPLQQALVIAHELGHALFRETFKEVRYNKPLWKRLEAEFKNEPNFGAYMDQYGDPDLAFEEWYADQVSNYALRTYTLENKGKAPRGFDVQYKGVVHRHFMDVARRLVDAFNALDEFFRARQGSPNTTFIAYMDEVVAAGRRDRSRRDSSTKVEEATPAVEELVDRSVEAVNGATGNGGNNGNGGNGTNRNMAPAPEYRRRLDLLSKIPAPLRSIFFTADSMLRAISPEIADMFYVRAQETGKGGRLGMLRAVNVQMGKFKNQFEEQVGNLNDPEIKAAIEEASSSVPTEQLTNEKAKQVRKFLENVYDTYIADSDTEIMRRDNYFPVVLDLMKIAENPEGFKQILRDNNPELSEQEIQESVERLVNGGQAIQDETITYIDPTNPDAGRARSRKLTRGIAPELLAGFTQSPDTAFITYMHGIVKKVEFDRATGGPEALRAKIEALSPEQQAQVEEIINAYMGYNSKPLSPFMRKLNSWGQFVQFVTILPFATIASLPDLAGPVINSKEWGALETGFKEIVRTIKNKQEAEELAREIGVVTSETVANAWVTEAEKDFMDPAVRSMSDAFFKYIGLDYYTKFTREFASNMGVQFVLKHANNPNLKSERYLADLGLTAADVQAWQAANRDFTTPEGKKVEKALQRFVESSILRPNAAERPVWASDPRYALIWQLKSYFYAYHQTITKGVLAERRTSIQEAGNDQAARLTANASILLLTAAATMPLAMLGMELREWAKFGLGTVVGKDRPERYFRSDKMDWGSYIHTIFDKSGFYGPMSMFLMAQQSQQWGRSGLVSLLGPTAETLELAVDNGWRIDKTITNRLLPVASWL